MINFFDERKKEKFMNALIYRLPPFDRFVAKGDIPEYEEVFSSRKGLLEKVAHILNSADHPIIIPVVGYTGSGKTHFLHGIKNDFNIEAFSSFIALPRSKAKFYYYVYSDLIEEFGAMNLRDFSQNFGDNHGAAQKLYGLFRTQNYNKVMINAFDSVKDNFLHLEALEQCVSVLIQHLMCPDKFNLAERWLLGQLMDIEDLFTLNINEDLSGENFASTMLKLLIDNYKKGIIILFDDFSKAMDEFDGISTFDDEDYDSDWAGTLIDECEENIVCNEEDKEKDSLMYKFYEMLINIKNFKLIISIERSRAKEIVDWFREKLGSKEHYIHNPVVLYQISLQDTLELYFERIRNFAFENNLLFHPAADREFNPKENFEEFYEKYGEDLFFPLNKKIIEGIHSASNGNVRTCLKNFKKIFDGLIFEEITPEQLKSGYNSFITV